MLKEFFKTPLKPLAFLSGYITLLTGFYSLMSGPLRELRLYELLQVDVDALSRAGRVVLVYHTLAVPFTALVAILFVSTLPFNEGRRNSIVHTLFFGSLVASISGLVFAYYRGGMLAHGLFLFGLSIVFYGGLNLTLSIFSLTSEEIKKCGISRGEKLAIGITFLSYLISAVIGASAGAFFGAGFKVFLAEDIIRESRNLLELAIISHLHIMLALLACAILLLISRYYSLSEATGRYYFPMVITGVAVTSAGTWLVMILEKTAHKIINVGVFFLLLAALVLAIRGFQLAFKRRDKLSFRWINFIYLILVNFFVTIPGIYVAVNLETFRLPEWVGIERTFAVGHWHVLGAICALMTLNILCDYVGIRGRFINLVGWATGLSATIAFSGIMLYMFHAPGESRDWAKFIFEPGIAVFLLGAVTLVISIFVKGFSSNGGSFLCEKSKEFSIRGEVS